MTVFVSLALISDIWQGTSETKGDLVDAYNNNTETEYKYYIIVLWTNGEGEVFGSGRRGLL